MKRLTPEQQTLIAQFAEKFPIPSTDEGCREWTGKLAQQFCFSFGALWGHKRADPGRPLSTDVIAYRDATTFIGYDILYNAGLPEVRLLTNPDPIDLTGQTFIAVPPVNHLGTIPIEELPLPVCQFRPLDIQPLLDRLVALEAKIDHLYNKPIPAPVVNFPEYTGKLGFTITLRPKG